MGRMGSAMARRLPRAGHDVVVYDVVTEAAFAVAADGAVATKPGLLRQALENQDLVKPADEIIELLKELPDRTYHTMAEVESEVGKIL